MGDFGADGGGVVSGIGLAFLVLICWFSVGSFLASIMQGLGLGGIGAGLVRFSPFCCFFLLLDWEEIIHGVWRWADMGRGR
jgi:hypothetical protein